MTIQEQNISEIAALFDGNPTARATIKYRATMKRDRRKLLFISLHSMVQLHMDKGRVNDDDLRDIVRALDRGAFLEQSNGAVIWKQPPTVFAQLMRKLEKKASIEPSGFKHSEIAIRQISCEFSSGKKVTVTLRQDLTAVEKDQLVGWFSRQVLG